MIPDIDTRMVTLIGRPLRQSFAARMQNAGYAAAGLNMLYFYTEAGSEHLGDIVNGIRHMNFAGFAVTKPNKIKILEYLDELDPLCARMGSSNTVVKTAEGKLVGYNTDGIGFYRSLTEEGRISAARRRFFCFGAGGAGRAICSALAYYGAEKIYITDYEEAAGRALEADLNEKFAPVAEFVPRDDYERLSSCDAVLNASGVGMGETRGQTPMPEEYVVKGQLYFDACYNPEKTQFLLNAEKRGARILNGLGMSLYQGAAQIGLWSGKLPPIDAMRRELLNILSGK